jgi:hypothetical protein
VPAALPRLLVEEDAIPDDCSEYVEDVGSGCDDEPSEDAGYRPFKALELNVVTKPSKNRDKPTLVEHQLEAAMNCLHGGLVTVKGMARPPAPAPQMRALPDGTMAVAEPVTEDDPDALGRGTIEIRNNRVNLDLYLYTKECAADTEEPAPPTEEFRAPVLASEEKPKGNNDLIA